MVEQLKSVLSFNHADKHVTIDTSVSSWLNDLNIILSTICYTINFIDGYSCDISNDLIILELQTNLRKLKSVLGVGLITHNKIQITLNRTSPSLIYDLNTIRSFVLCRQWTNKINIFITAGNINTINESKPTTSILIKFIHHCRQYFSMA
jgi:hypothetical protein